MMKKGFTNVAFEESLKKLRCLPCRRENLMMEDLLRKRGLDLLVRSKGKNKGRYLGITGKHFRPKQMRNIPPVKAIKRKLLF